MMLTACALLAGTTLIAKTLGPVGSGTDALQPASGHGGPLHLRGHGAPAVHPCGIDRPSAVRPGAITPCASASAGRGVSLLSFAAASMMRLADATAISFLNPIVAMILAIPLLGEKVGPWRWGAAGIGLRGGRRVERAGIGRHPACRPDCPAGRLLHGRRGDPHQEAQRFPSRPCAYWPSTTWPAWCWR